jgi:hypothetical protein
MHQTIEHNTIQVAVTTLRGPLEKNLRNCFSVKFISFTGRRRELALGNMTGGTHCRNFKIYYVVMLNHISPKANLVL